MFAHYRKTSKCRRNLVSITSGFENHLLSIDPQLAMTPEVQAWLDDVYERAAVIDAQEGRKPKIS